MGFDAPVALGAVPARLAGQVISLPPEDFTRQACGPKMPVRLPGAGFHSATRRIFKSLSIMHVPRLSRAGCGNS
jgi:hypothetical protein